MSLSARRLAVVAAVALGLPPRVLSAQRDTSRAPTLEPVTVRAAPDSTPAPPLATFALRLDDVLKGRAAIGLDEALSLVPGLLAQNRYNYSLDTRVTSRGFGARSAFGVRGITILLDGVPQTLPDGQGQLTNVDLDAADEVAVVRGAGAAFYGNAAGGLVSLRSGSLLGVGLSGRARLVGGSYGLLRWSASGTAPVSGGGVGVTLSGLSIDGFRAHSLARQRQGTTSLELPLSHNVSAALRVRVADLPRADNPGALTDSLRDADPSSAHPRNLAQNAGKAVRQTQASIALTHRSGQGETDIVIHGLARDLDNPLATGRSGYVLLDRTGGGARLSLRRSLGAGPGTAELLAGLDAQRQDDDRQNYDNTAGIRGDTLRVDQRETVDGIGARAALAVQLRPGTRVLSGIRYDRTRYQVEDRLTADGDDSGDRTMNAFSFTAGLTHVMGRGTSLYGNAGSTFDTPTTTELANPGSGGLNSSLMPQSSLQVELGLRHAGSAHSFTLAAYSTDVRNGLLPFEVPSAPGRFMYRNSGRTRHQGLELEGSVRMRVWLDAGGALSLNRHRFTAFPTDSTPLDGRTLPGVPSATATVELRARPARSFWAALEWRGAGRTFADDANTLSEGAWSTIDMRLAWDIGHTRLSAGVNNLLDARYAGALTVNGFAGRVYEPAPGLNWYVGMSVRSGS